MNKIENGWQLVPVEPMTEHKPVAWAATDETGTVVEALSMNQSRRFSDPLYLHPPTLRMPMPMTEEEIYDNDEIMGANCFAGLMFEDFAAVVRIIEAAVLRRVREANK